MLGWFLDIAVIKSLGPGFSTMKFNTALCFLLAGGSLWVASRDIESKTLIILRHALSGSILMIGFLSIAQYQFNWNLGIDQILVKDDDSDVFPGRMSFATGFAFTLLGSAFLIGNIKWHRAELVAQSLAVAVIFISVFALVGYVMGTTAIYRFPWFESVALHTAVLFFLCGLAVLLLHPHIGIMEIGRAHV